MPKTVHRTIQIALDYDTDLKATLVAFQQVCNAPLTVRLNNKPLNPTCLHKVAYHQVRGRDAHFCPDGTISIWTLAGRKRLCYHLPPSFRPSLSAAVKTTALWSRRDEGGWLVTSVLSCQPLNLGAIPLFGASLIRRRCWVSLFCLSVLLVSLNFALLR